MFKNYYKSIIAITLLLSFSKSISSGYPIEINNCGENIQFNKPPERIFMVNNDSISLLSHLGLLERVVVRTSKELKSIYNKKTLEILSKIPNANNKKTATGGSIVTLESILKYKPDLVLAPESSIDRKLLKKSGVNLYSPPIYCTKKPKEALNKATFNNIYKEIDNFGKIFNIQDLANKKIKHLKNIASNLEKKYNKKNITGVGVYVSGSGVLYPYGKSSMVTPILDSIGVRNIYDNKKERVFEANIEDILGKNPDIIVLLYSSGKPKDIIKKFKNVNGAGYLKATRTNNIIAFPFAYTDPASPHSIYGAQILSNEINYND